jgi:WD40 repeat protein
MLKGELIRCLTVDQTINAFDVSADATRLATCSGRSAFIWTCQKLQLVHRINRKPAAVHRARLRLIRFTNNVDVIITACNDHRIVVWNLNNGQTAHPAYILDGHAGTIYDAVFNADGDLLYTAGADGRVLVWNWAQGERLQSAIAESAPVRAIALNVPFRRLACATVIGSVGIWDPAEQTRICTVEGDSEWVLSQTGTATRSGWMDSVRSHSGPVLAAAFSPNGALFLTGAGDATAKLWSALSFRTDSDAASSQLAAVKVGTRKVQLREAVDDGADDVVNGTESPLTVGFYAAVLYTLLHEAPVERVLFTHDSKYIVTCARDDTIKVE